MSSLQFSRVVPQVVAAGPSFITFVFFSAFFWHVSLLRLAHPQGVTPPPRPPIKVLEKIGVIWNAECIDLEELGWDDCVIVDGVLYEWVDEPSDTEAGVANEETARPPIRPWLLDVLRITSSIASFLYNTAYICYAVFGALWSAILDMVVAYAFSPDTVAEGIAWLCGYLYRNLKHDLLLYETTNFGALTTLPLVDAALEHTPAPVVAGFAPAPVSFAERWAHIEALVGAIPKGPLSDDDGERVDVGRWEEENLVEEEEKEEKEVVVSGDEQQSGAATQAPAVDHEERPSHNEAMPDAPLALFSSTISQVPSHGAPSWTSITNPLVPSPVATHGLPPPQQVNVYNAPAPVAQMQQSLVPAAQTQQSQLTTLLPPLPAPLSLPAPPQAIQTSQNSSYGDGYGSQVGNHLMPLQHVAHVAPAPLPGYVLAFAIWCARQPPPPPALPAYSLAFAAECARAAAASAAETAAAPAFSSSDFYARLAALGAPAFPAPAPAPAALPAPAPAPFFSAPVPAHAPLLAAPAAPIFPAPVFSAAPPAPTPVGPVAPAVSAPPAPVAPTFSAPAPSGPASLPAPIFSGQAVLSGPAAAPSAAPAPASARAAPSAPPGPAHDDGLDAFEEAFNAEYKKQNPAEFAPQATAAQMAARKISKGKAKATGLTNAGAVTKPDVEMAGAPSSFAQRQQQQQKSLPSAGSAGVRNIPPSKDVKQQQQKSSPDAGSAGSRNMPPAPQQGGAATPSPRPLPAVNKNRPTPMDVDRCPPPSTPEEKLASLTDFASSLLGASALTSSSSSAAAQKRPVARPLPQPNFRPAPTPPAPAPAAGPTARKKPGGGSRPAPVAPTPSPPKPVAQPKYDGGASYRAADGTIYDISWDEETGEEFLWAGDGQKVVFDTKRGPVDGNTGLPWSG